MMTILKFALLGAGRIGKIHAANIALNPKCSIECIYDIDSNNAKKISRYLNIKSRSNSSIKNI